MAKRMRTEAKCSQQLRINAYGGSSGLALRADVHFSRLLAASADSLCLVTGGYALAKAAPDCGQNTNYDDTFISALHETGH